MTGIAARSTETGRRKTDDAAGTGAALAALLAAGIGAFAVGLFALLHASGVFSAPALYPPAGGVSGRTTFAVLVWLVSWWVLHRRWREGQVRAGRVLAVTLVLIAAGVLASLPPVWTLF